MAFYYVYKSLAHPEANGYVQPLTIEERLAHVTKARESLDTRIPWLADSMDNDLKHAFGDRNNSEFVISPEGEVLIARSWSDPAQLRKDLIALVGEPETNSEPAAIDPLAKIAEHDRPDKIASGVVPRVQRPSGAVALKVSPIAEEKEESSEEPFYLKLRAELSPAVLRSGNEGELYLGFHLDPIHNVHWNNLAPPLKFEISSPEGIEIEPASQIAPKPEKAEADIDPREFLIRLKPDGALSDTDPLVVEVVYFACDDQDRWCKSITQKFTIQFEEDRDGGKARTSGSRSRNRPSPGSRVPEVSNILSRYDKDDDKRISKEESQGPMEKRFDWIDENEDGFLDEKELHRMRERMKNR